MKLVIVESPTKCHTIKKYLGDDYEVIASKGHIRDLATCGKGGFGVDIENNFAPTYIVPNAKKATVKSLKTLKNKAEEVILATDPDREGEAIAWHLATVLGLDIEKTKRLEFHEITRESISNAIANPRRIDMRIIDSQEARRIIDRIMGFMLSDLIKKKIHSKSAGRVQSATLKMIADHELEIEKFVSEEYWNINAKAKVFNNEINLNYLGKDKKEVRTEDEANEVLKALSDTLTVTEVSTSIKIKEPKKPFTTSTLQQEAYSKLKFSPKKTASLSQQLYEGVLINGEFTGLITYIRTPSSRLSTDFVNRATNYIKKEIGEEYLQSKAKIAMLSEDKDGGPHEAIRPSSNHLTPESVREFLTVDQYKLYKLIYNRALAALMKAKKEEEMHVTLESNQYRFSFKFTRPIFKGYEAIYADSDSPSEYIKEFPTIEVGNTFELVEKSKEQKFTQPPNHYSEGKIVELMESNGIGRPSTYATTIDLLKKREYVLSDHGVLTITDQGKKTSHVLNKYFPRYMNLKYTAGMENALDDVVKGDNTRNELLVQFYKKFTIAINNAKELMYRDEFDPVGRDCPDCGNPLVYKTSRYGKFIGCSNYPECKHVEKIPLEKTGELCPECGSPLVIVPYKNGKSFISCSNLENCKYRVFPKTKSKRFKPYSKKK